MKKAREGILAMVMAGGMGTRLYPLTLERTKPSVPFGGKYRIVDFALSNLINSKIYSIYVLVQYKSQSLIEHIRTTWIKAGLIPEHFITLVPPQMRRAREWYKGTADSVFQNINLIYDFKPKLVAIFGADHVYRMNIGDMVDYHLQKKAKVTISVIPVDSKEADQFGIVDVDRSFRVKNFREKPHMKAGKTVLASMGNYIFDTDFLVEALEKDAKKRDSDHDFGKNIIPYLVKNKHEAYAYDFTKNKIPTAEGFEAKSYWKDVGTIQSYWEANMDLLGEQPKLDLNHPDWPIFASTLNCPPAYIVGSEIENSLISEGTRICNAKVKNSIIGRAVTIGAHCVIENSIILDFTHIEKSSCIRNTVIDRFNIVKAGTNIGYNRTEDRKKYHLDSSGIVVVKRGSRKAFYF